MPVAVTPSNPTQDSGYLQLNVTIVSTGVAQPLSADKLGCSEYMLQVPNGGASIRIGGRSVTVSTGAFLHPPATAAETPDAFSDYIDDLSKVYVIGTSGTVVNCLYRTL